MFLLGEHSVVFTIMLDEENKKIVVDVLEDEDDS